MLRATLLSASVLLFTTMTAASPALVARSCTPNFQGQAQTIYAHGNSNANVFEWIPDTIAPGAHITEQDHSATSAFATGEFLVQFSGQPDGSFVFK